MIYIPKFDVSEIIRTKHPQSRDVMVTAITIRGTSAMTYECSYTQDGDPKAAWMQECELEKIDKQKQIGFGKK